MTNMNKILITIVSCVFMICVASVSIVSIVTSDEKESTTTTAAVPAESTSQVASTSATSQSTTTVNDTSTTQGTSLPSTSATVAGTESTLATAILGKWTDSAGMSGFEFMDGGRVNCTYVDLAQFGVPFDGKASGLYTLDGDTLTIKFSIYTATIKKVYRASVSGNELSLYDLEEFETSTYAKVS